MALTFFVTGTDTHVGKTFVTAALLRALNAEGLKTVGLKPLASGCVWQEGAWKNDDALILQQAASQFLPYAVINPIALIDPVAPHLAARKQGQNLSLEKLAMALQPGLNVDADVTLIEGAGGWYVPLNEQDYFSDLARVLSLPVILVVGIRLGCINHALLTVAAIEHAGVSLAGWVANCVDPSMDCREENIDCLRQKIAAPCLGVLPYFSAQDDVTAAAAHLHTHFVL